MRIIIYYWILNFELRLNPNFYRSILFRLIRLGLIYEFYLKFHLNKFSRVILFVSLNMKSKNLLIPSYQGFFKYSLLNTIIAHLFDALSFI
jgi:hypothetical protein